MGQVLVHRSPLQGDPDRFDTDLLHADRGVVQVRAARGNPW